MAVFLALSAAATAEAVTLRELVDLSKAGLSDDILIALVEADKSSFQLTAKDVQELKKAGLTDKVLLHLIQTPELRRAELAAPPALPPVTVVEPVRQRERRPARETVVVVDRVETVAVPVPVYVPVRDRPRPRPEKESKPEYWGYGGKLRPGSWRDQ